jgi:putative transposase
MRESRYSDEQIVAILKEQETGIPTAEICRRYRISKATFYGWKSKYGGEFSKANRQKELEDENRKLKKILVEQIIENATLKEMLTKSRQGPP